MMLRRYHDPVTEEETAEEVVESAESVAEEETAEEDVKSKDKKKAGK